MSPIFAGGRKRVGVMGSTERKNMSAEAGEKPWGFRGANGP